MVGADDAADTARAPLDIIPQNASADVDEWLVRALQASRAGTTGLNGPRALTLGERRRRAALDYANRLAAHARRASNKTQQEAAARQAAAPHGVTTLLQRLGYNIAIISGGFQQIADMVKRDLGLDYAFANKLEVRRPAQ